MCAASGRLTRLRKNACNDVFCVHAPSLTKESLFPVSEKWNKSHSHSLAFMISPLMIVSLVIYLVIGQDEEEDEVGFGKYVVQFGINN